MPPSSTPPDIRAAALADLLAGEQPAAVAERYHLDRELVKQWKRRHVDPVPAAVSPDVSPDVSPRVPTPPAGMRRLHPQKSAVGELLIDLLRAKLHASLAIAQAATDPAWLARQTAADLAALGDYLDRSIFHLGDRLAQHAPSAPLLADPDTDPAGPGGAAL